jgi:multimeric flavodoxin WrbA
MKGKKAVILIGSPRARGNCAALADRVGKGIEDSGGAVELVRLHGMDIRPCTACDSCQKDEDSGCVVEDDMQKLYPLLREADGLVVASPVYWFTVSAQTKLFMDRCYAFGGPGGHAFKGKRIGIILTYGDVDPFRSGAVNALRTFQDAYGYIGAEIRGMVYGSALGPGEITKNRALMAEAYELGKSLL